MIIYLVRHGVSIANERGLVTGTSSDPLSKTGVQQATHLCNWVTNLDIKADCYFVSHWKRAQQTAEIAFPKVTWEEDCRIGETFAGDAAEMELKDFIEEYPYFYLKPQNAYLNGESHIDLNKRVIKWLHELLNKPHKSAVVVAHSGPIACILQHILKIPMEQFPALLPLNATITPIEALLTDDGMIQGRVVGFSLGPIENLSSILPGRR